MSDEDLQENNIGLKITPNGAKSAIIKAIKAKKVPMLHGSPAIGKSSVVHAIAEQFNLKVIDLRLAESEPTDMSGFPYTDMVRMKSGYIPMDTFPIKSDPLPRRPVTDDPNDPDNGREYAGWLLFLDELTSAKSEVQAAAYKLILDRKTGQHDLHPKVAIVGAGNLESDNAIVQPMSTALQTRMIHLVLDISLREWVTWAIEKKIDHRITDFVQFRPQLLYNFSPDHTDKTYASPRTWEFTNDILTTCGGDIKDPDFMVLASGCVTEGVTREFLTFCDIYANLPKIADILIAPGTVPMPSEPSILFALSGSLGSHANSTNMEKLLPFVLRMPLEFQVVTLRYIIKSNRAMLANKGITDWVTKHGAELF